MRLIPGSDALLGVRSEQIAENQNGSRSRNLRRLTGALPLLALFYIGSVSASESITYQYDSLGRLTSAQRSGGTQTVYTLDASGNRTQVQTSGATPPGVPSSLSVPPTSSGSYTVSWGGSTGIVTAYELYESSNSGFSPQTRVYSGTGTSLAYSGKTTGTYFYRVRACNSSACSDYQGPASVVVNTSPPSPITISDRTVTTDLSSFSVTTTYQLTTGGDIMATTLSSMGLSDVGDWISPKSGMSSYQVRRASGGCNGPGVGAWVPFTSSPSWSITVGSPATQVNCSMTIEFSAVANPSIILATATITLQAKRH